MEHKTPDIEPPSAYEWIWDFFWELSSNRTQHQYGPNPLTYQDFIAWSNVTGNLIIREEVEILKKMDRTFLSALREELDAHRERERAKGKNK